MLHSRRQPHEHGLGSRFRRPSGPALIAALGSVAPAAATAQVFLGGEFQVNTYTPDTQIYPAVAARASGDFVVTWQSRLQDGSNYGVFARRFSSAGVALASEFQVNTYTSNSQSYPRLAFLASGDFVVVWDSNGQDGDEYGVFARRFASTGAALASEFQVNTVTANRQHQPVVAAGASGDFVVAWKGVDDGASPYGVLARRFSSAGTALATELVVNTFTTGAQLSPAVAVAPSGDFLVAWESNDQDGSGEGVFAQHFSSAGIALAAEFQVNSYTPYPQGKPAVASDDDGDFVVAWNSRYQDGSDYGIFARSFSSAGVALASEFQVSSFTAETQRYPQIARAAPGGFVVAWQSDSRDGSSYGVFAQRLLVPKTLDIDADGSIGALTDGLLVLRFLFGFTGTTLTSGAVNTNGCTRCNAATIEPYLQTLI